MKNWVMLIYNFKVIYLSLFIISLICSSCIRILDTTYLKTKDGSDIVLYQENDSTLIKLLGSMKEVNNYIIDNNNFLKDSNYVRIDCRLKNIDSIIINEFYINLWMSKNLERIRITDGKISIDPNLDISNESYTVNLVDTIKSKSSHPSWNFWSMFIVKTEPSLEIEKADYFIIDLYLDYSINNEQLVVHKVDSLYRKKERTSGLTVH